MARADSGRTTTAPAATATRTPSPPVIDGRDNDAPWRDAQRITGFRLFDPTEDGEPTMATEARIIYDDASIYLFVRE